MMRFPSPRPLTLVLALCTAGMAFASTEDPDARAARVEAQMMDAERLSLLVGIMPIPFPGSKVVIPAGVPVTAGYVPGVPRLGVPPQLATDAGLGVTNPNLGREGDSATAMPASLALAASFDVALAERYGAAVATEARAKGFNVLLGGGLNLARDPRNGRNFEYLGEDPLLAGRLAGHAIRGSQAQGVVSTIKHLALNAQETLRMTADAVIDDAALRESELLAFQIGIEIGKPGSVMCAYNLVNGVKACGSDYLLNQVLKRDWGYRGWVMSDWGAVSDVRFIHAGLDQQAGSQLDREVWFGEPLHKLVASGEVSRERIGDAVRRMLRSLYAVGIEAPYEPRALDEATQKTHAALARETAQAGIVLLKNDGVLPLADVSKGAPKKVLVIGGQAEFGVLSGGGSSQVAPSNGAPRIIEGGGQGGMVNFARQWYMPGAPLAALRSALPGASVTFNAGYSADSAAAYAAQADVVLVFATRWEGEGVDFGSLSLPQGQDELIAKVAAANRNTVVVLQTGNPVLMPWQGHVRAVVQAWYPGQEGGQAIADVLTGAVNPAGRLPLSFPASLAQLPRPAIPGAGLPQRTTVKVPYTEGSDAGYRWFARTGAKPLYAFGHGLSYTRFSHHQPSTRLEGAKVTLQVSVRNDGERSGADVPQAYLVARNGKPLQRLVGFQKVTLASGAAETVRITVDPRLLADFRDGQWQVPAGRYRFAFGKSAASLGPAIEVTLPAQTLAP